MKNGKLVVGQIGCGAFAEFQDLRNFTRHRDCILKWCCDISAARAQAMAGKFGVPHHTDDFTHVINDPEVDLVKIATSHEAHLPIILAAAAAHKHVFCEKPMAMHEEEAFAIMRAVRKSGIKFCVDLNRRMAPSMTALRRRWLEHKNQPRHNPWRYTEIKRDLLPEERNTHFLINVQDESLSYRLVHLDPVRGGGVIIAESVHWLDLACWFFAPQLPVEVLAWGSPRMSHGINISFSGGDDATLIFSCGGTFDYPKEFYEITHNGALFRNCFFVENNYYGVPGTATEKFPLQFDGMNDIGTEGGLAGYLKKYQAKVGSSSNSRQELGEISVDKGHAAMLNGFIDAIRNDTPSPCDETAGWVSTMLARQAIRSIELRQCINITPDKVLPCLV